MMQSFSRGKWRLTISVLSAAIAAVVVGLVVFSRSATPIYLGAIAPLSGQQQLNGQQAIDGIRLALEEVNDRGGIDGHPVELVVFDDASDPDVAIEQAQRAVASDAVAVLGHYFSSTSVAAGDVYKQAHLPAITGSATADSVTADNDWYFRTIFDNASQAKFLANYAYQVLGQTTANILVQTDDYGRSLASEFETTFQGLGGTVRDIWDFPTEGDISNEILTAMVDDLSEARANQEEPGLVFCATHDSDAVQAIVRLRRSGFQVPIMGGDALGKASLIDLFARFPEEQANPGYFSDGVSAISPVLFEVGGEAAQAFRDRFIETYDREPSWMAATYYDAASVATEAIERAQITPRTPVDAARTSLRRALAGANRLDTSFQGMVSPIYFDREGNTPGQFPMAIFDRHQLIPTPIQLQPVTDLRSLNGIDQQLEAGTVGIVDSRYVHKVNIAYTGLSINSVSAFDIKNSTYVVDCYLWFRYTGDLNAEEIEFINAVDLEVNDLFASEDDGDRHYRAYRIKGTFRGDFDLSEYPFDQQELSIRFRHPNLFIDRLVYVRDAVGLREDRSFIERSKESLSGWTVNRVNYFHDIGTSQSTLGNPQLLNPKFDDSLPYSRFNVSIEMRRDSLSFIVKNLFPLFLFVTAAYLVLFLPPDAIAPRTVAGFNAILASAFLHVRLSGDLPDIGYVVSIEYIFYAVYGLCLLALSATVANHVAFKQSRKDLALKIDRSIKRIYPLAVLVAVVIVSAKYAPAAIEQALSNPTPTPTPAVAIADNRVPNTNSSTSPSETSEPASETVTLTLASWRVDDEILLNRILASFTEQYPHIDIQFLPTFPVDYQSILEDQLASEQGPDLFYVRPFARGQQLIDSGFVQSLDDGQLSLDGQSNPDGPFNLSERYPPEILELWSDGQGHPYAVPVMAVSHGIYYNQSLFDELGLPLPTTWDELLSASARLQEAGHIPFANGTGSEAHFVEEVFMNVAPNYLGGREGRLAYLDGERCFDDDRFVAAFGAIADIRPYLPANHPQLSPTDSKQLFLSGQAAMWFGGSWEISGLTVSQPDFEWSVFAVPPPAGQPGYVTFHPDFAIGLNANSPHQEAALEFLRWLSTPETTEQFSNELPGFFPLHRSKPTIQNPQARVFLDFNDIHDVDVRLPSQVLDDGLPKGYNLMQAGAVAVAREEQTPQAAAESLQSGLSQWLKPAQTCRQDSRMPHIS